ncbi:spore cortex biosynthesis protein YabQ [Salinibacillus xinjiangensis]|uniref:Spore cortex biosynthesis protein YabQ n=1 Tax=Salinibacillus xinjiangensis TaxID=1229268 RepID=A0A6G1XB24_9BACI|nr:spore cortex biosynthesis protein YabQ [Salinibacillus xinjiangensis]MRG88184.1 spore cortex biosynthesis protein YabQ [Salinibacillus xinjiangensis]
MSLSLQFFTMMVMVASGIYLGMAIDTFHRFHNHKKRSDISKYANEILFWILQGLVIFYILYLTNQGQLRLYVWLALLFGIAFYQSVLRVMYLKVLEGMIQYSVATFRFLNRLFQRLVIAPLTKLFKLTTYLLTLFWAVVIWILLIPWKIFRRPLMYVWNKIKSAIPRGWKKNILSFSRFCSRIIDTIIERWKMIFSKRR